MAIVRQIGQGYYGIDLSDVGLDPSVSLAVDRAFDAAMSISSDNFDIRLTDKFLDV